MGIRTRLGRALIGVALIAATLGVHDARALEVGTLPGWQPPTAIQGLHPAPPRYVFLFVLDGGLPSYLKLADYPHVAALIHNGTRYTRAWDGMLETETPTGHASLGTGSIPAHHGVISFSWVNDQSGLQHPTNPQPIHDGDLEQVLYRSGAPSLASLLKKHDPSARIAVTSGHKDYAVDSVGGWAADYLMFYGFRGSTWVPEAIPRHVPPRPVLDAPGLTAYAPRMGPGDQDSLAVNLAMSSFDRLHPRVTIINLPEFDWPLGHLDGGSADGWLAWRLMTRFDADLANIESQLAAQHVLKETLFVLTADHGMLDLRHTIPYSQIDNAVHTAGTSLDEYHYHSAAYLWIHDRSRAPEVARNFVALRNPHIRAVYYRKPNSYAYVLASPRSWLASPAVARAYTFLLSTFAGPSAPHVVVLLAENTSIAGRNETNWKGDHGGASWNAEHIPLILSGPGVRRDYVSRFPATIYDVAPTILHLLGAQSQGMDGVPLDDALTAPSPDLEAQQQQQGAELTPVQNAIMAQSRADTR